MKYRLIFVTVIFFLSTTALYAEDFVVDEAMKAYQANNYEMATNIFLSDYGHLNNLSANDKLKAAITFSKNLKVYREIYEKSLLTQITYLQTLIDSKNNSSAYATLYLAEAYYLKGNLDESDTTFRKIDRQLITDRSEKRHYHFVGALISHQSQQTDEYITHRNAFNTTNSLDQLFLNTIDIVLFNENKLTTEDLSEFISEDKQQKIHAVDQNMHHILNAYIAQNRLDLAAARVIKLDKQQPAYVEKLSETKVIRFYDLALTHTLSIFYYKMSKLLLEKLTDHEKLGHIANFYLADLELLMANRQSAENYQKKLKHLTLLPKTLANTIEIRSAAHGYLAGNHNRAYQTLEQAVDNLKNDPLISAEAVLMCIYIQANCPTIVKSGQLMAESGKSERYTALSLNVGRYFLSKNELTKATRLIEGALLKSGNNSIFANDPILLINLAEVRRLNKNYSDSLQIYFSAAKDYPIMRQIQDAVQGEYLFEQRSSGIPTIF